MKKWLLAATSLRALAPIFSGLFVGFLFRHREQCFREPLEALERRVGTVLVGFFHESTLRFFRQHGKARDFHGAGAI